MSEGMGHEIYPENLQVRTQVLLVGRLGKSELVSMMKHLELRR